MRVAVVDCGTNTMRLLIADGDGIGPVAEVDRRLEFVRLGEGVDATGLFNPEALRRTFVAAESYARVIAESQVDKVRFVATSAARDVSNRGEFFAGIQSRLGVTPDVISGDEEAQLSFLGALAGGPLGCDSAEPGVLVVDIGGGSTELIRGTASGQVREKTSLNMGSVRIRERILRHDPPEADEITAARAFVADLLDCCDVGLDGVTVCIGVAGTMTSLSGMNQGLAVYDRAAVHNSQMSVDDIESICDRLSTLTVADTIDQYPSLQPERAEVIATGALICSEITRRTGRPMTVRETDILDGAASQLMRS
ncbi:MAG: exopolyphosphatase [Propionibacteriaceae bacterium]|nr:exopolyphosphatase [Propionibacteriaceae bacterium]